MVNLAPFLFFNTLCSIEESIGFISVIAILDVMLKALAKLNGHVEGKSCSVTKKHKS